MLSVTMADPFYEEEWSEQSSEKRFALKYVEIIKRNKWK
jgi:hypothetical protein